MTGERKPLEVCLSSAIECDLVDDDGLPVLVVRDGNIVAARIVGSGDHTEALAGIRKVIDGLWMLHGSVIGARWHAEIEARRRAEAALVDAEGIPDGQLGEAARTAESGSMPSVRPLRLYPPPGAADVY